MIKLLQVIKGGTVMRCQPPDDFLGSSKLVVLKEGRVTLFQLSYMRSEESSNTKKERQAIEHTESHK